MNDGVCVNRDHLPSSLYFSLELSDLMIYGWPKYEFHRIKNFAFKAEGLSSICIEIFEHESSSSGPDGHIFGWVCYEIMFLNSYFYFSGEFHEKKIKFWKTIN